MALDPGNWFVDIVVLAVRGPGFGLIALFAPQLLIRRKALAEALCWLIGIGIWAVVFVVWNVFFFD